MTLSKERENLRAVNSSLLPRLFRCLTTTMVVAFSVFLAIPSSAENAISPKLIEVQNEVRTTTGPARYTKLRKLWSLWDDTDPQHVEQALRQLKEDPRLDPSSRAYAGLLSAYARRRRGDLRTAKTEIADLGFVNQWLVVGPFDNEGRSGFDRVFGPEATLGDVLDLQQMHEGKEREVHWRTIPSVSGFGWLDLGSLMRPEQRICSYASTFVRSRDERPRLASVWIGTTGSFRLFWNAEEVLSDGLYRMLDAERFVTTVEVKPGWNRLTVKVCGDVDSPVLSLRLGNARGAPDPSLTTSSDPSLAHDAVRNSVDKKDKAEEARLTVRVQGSEGSIRPATAPPLRQKDPGNLQGPVNQFESRLKTQGTQASTLEAFARYLVITGGDDPVKHLARDYAIRAAEQSPTIDRFLLAASLGEDRNQQRNWIEKAIQKAANDPPIDLLLAQARLARSGPHWREAIPFYDRALEKDPNNLEALLGRVDLYHEAGLQRTALDMLEKAVSRHPRSISLLRIYALQLATLGRQTEAEEVGNRYGAYRFDDPTRHVAKIDLAVSRREDDVAQHWIDRLMESSPDSAYHVSVVAKAYVRMGKWDKAIETYHQVLAMTPEDTNTMIELSDLFGRLGQQQQQLGLLHQVLELRPQFKDIREYVEHIEPKQPRADEAYAWSADRFLSLRAASADGFNQRTLRDLQVTTVFPSGLSSTFKQVVFQPLTEEAAASARIYSFGYQADREVVQLRSARVYRGDGRVDETIETSSMPVNNPAIAMYTSGRVFYVRFPRLDVGDVVEIQYRTEEIVSNNVFADYFGQVRFMQSSEPSRNMEYVLIAPASRKLLFDASPLPGLQQEEKQQGDKKILRFFTPEVRPIGPEPNMPPWPEVLGHVHVSTYDSWKDVGTWYWGLAKEQLNPDDEVRKKALELTKECKTEEEKVRAIYGWVVKRTRYVALEFGIYGYKPHRASQTLARGWGDCKDKATLIVSMLQVVGIPANLVIVRTALQGAFPSALPSLAPFDHAIAHVPSLDLYLDGTAEYTGSTEFPAFDRDAMALIVHPEQSRLVSLPNPPASTTVRHKDLTAKISPDGSARISLNFEVSGAIAAQWRLRYHGENTRRERIASDIAQTLPGFVMLPGRVGLEAGDMENIEQPVQMRIDGLSPAFARKQGSDLSFALTPHDRFVALLASASQRKMDLVLPYLSTIDENWTVEIPSGMKVRELPNSQQLTTPFGSFLLEVKQEGDKVVKARTRVTFDKKRIEPKEYPAFVKFCEQTDRALNQRVLLAK